jgi:hypothetical protein
MRANFATRRQDGMALLALMAIVVLVMAYVLVSRFNAASAFVAIDRDQNGKVLNQAKQALIGWAARQAATTGENNPGRLPCPEAGAFFGTANEGTAAGNCTLPAIGRLPWRTLGLDKLVDAANEPLWYVVSPGWALSNSTMPALTTYINSNSVGQLTVDGLANNAVALIIAPGRTFNAATACSAVAQVRAVAGAPNRTNYLECDNAAGATFVTTGASDAFNDQVVRVTAAEVLPEIEAAIAERIAREIVPALQTVYLPAAWGFPGSDPLYPFPAPFSDPSTSNMQGAVASTQGGLLPLSYAETSPMSGVACTPSGAEPRCRPAFVAWSGTPTMSTGGATYSEDCSTSTATAINCKYYYRCFLIFCDPGNATFTINATAANVGMAMRRLNRDVPMTNVQPHGTAPRTVSATLNSNGSATVTITGTTSYSGGGAFLSSLLANTLCGVSGILALTVGCKEESLSIPVLVLADHSFLDPTTTGAGATGWYLRNRWHEVTYYAVASGYSPAGLPGTPACTTGTNCLTVRNTTPDDNKRSVLLLAGRSRLGTVGANRTLADFLDSAENQSVDGTFEKLPVGSLSNDRVIVVDSN